MDDPDETVHAGMLNILAGGPDGSERGTPGWVLRVVATIAIGGLIGFRLTAGRERTTATDIVRAARVIQTAQDRAPPAAGAQEASDRPGVSLRSEEDNGPTALQPRTLPVLPENPNLL